MILLVEGSRFLRLASERALVKAGYEVASVVDGEAAMLMARERIPNLILVDMMLPKLDGWGSSRFEKRFPNCRHSCHRALGPWSTKRSEAQKGRCGSLLYKIRFVLRERFRHVASSC